MSDQNENISITLRAKIDELQRASTSVIGELDRIRKATDDVNKTNEEAGRTSDIHAKAMSRQMVSAVAMGGAVAAASVTIYQMTKAAIDAADELNDLSQKTGVSVEQLAGLKLAAEQNGTTLEAVAGGVKNLSRFMVTHGEVLKSVGITSRDADGAMLQLADLFKRMPDGIEKTNLAVKVFGRSGQDMIPLLNQGSAGLQEVIEKGQKLNPVTAEMAKQADLFNDQLAELKTAASGVGTVMANAVLPALNAVVSRLIEGATASRSMAGGLNALVYGAYTDKSLKGKIADYEGGNEGGILQDQYEQMVREARRRGIMPGELKATTFSDAGFEAQQRADEEAVKALTGPKEKPAKGGKAAKDNKEGFEGYRSVILQFELAEQAAEWERIKQKDAEELANLNLIYQNSAQERIERARLANLTESAREQEEYSARVIELDLQRQDELARYAGNLEEQARIDGEYKALREETELQHQAKLGSLSAKAQLDRMAFERLNTVQQASAISGLLVSHLAAVSNKNRAFFYAHKLGSIAQATISTYEGANKALAMGPWGIPLAGMIIAAGLANVAQIKAQRFEGGGGGGGGSLPSYSAGQAGQDFLGSTQSGPPVPVTQAQAAAPTSELRIVLMGEFADSLVDAILPSIENRWINGAGNMRLVLERSQ